MTIPAILRYPVKEAMPCIRCLMICLFSGLFVSGNSDENQALEKLQLPDAVFEKGKMQAEQPTAKYQGKIDSAMFVWQGGAAGN